MNRSWLRASMGVNLEGFTLTKTYSTDMQKVYFHESSDCVVIGFDQTEGVYWPPSKDWWKNFMFWKKTFTLGKWFLKVHFGFGIEYQSVRNEILNWIIAKNPKKIIVSGFSQGGALTSICFFDLMDLFGIPVEGHAYAAPRAFGILSSLIFNWKLKRRKDCTFVRHTWGGDAVTGQPPAAFLYRHVGPEDIFVEEHKFLRNNDKVHNQEAYLQYIETYGVAT